MSSFDKLGPFGKKAVEEFMALSQEQQKDVIATLIKWQYTDDMVNDLRSAIQVVIDQ